MNLLMYMAPVAVAFLLPASLFMESNVIGITIALAREDFRIVWYLLFNSSLAYFVNLTNFLVTKHTSALTLQVFLSALMHKWFTYYECSMIYLVLMRLNFILPIHLMISMLKFNTFMPLLKQVQYSDIKLSLIIVALGHIFGSVFNIYDHG